MFSLINAINTEGASNLLTQVDWSKPTWDLFIVLFFIIVAFVYGISLGRDRIMVIMVSIYMSLAVVNSAPETIVVKNLFAIQVSAFIGVFLLLFFLLSRSALLSSIASSDVKGAWWQAIVFSVLHVGLLISVILSYLPKTALTHLSPTTLNFFVHDPAPFLWVIAPIMTMMLIRASGVDKKYKYDI